MKNSNKKMIALLVLLAIILLLASGAFFYFFVWGSSNKPQQDVEENIPSETQTNAQEQTVVSNSEDSVNQSLLEQGYTQEMINDIGYNKYYVYFDDDDVAHYAETFDSYNADLDIAEYPVDEMEKVLQDAYEKIFYHRYDDLKQQFDDLRNKYKFTNFDLYELTSLMHDVDILSGIRKDADHKRTDYVNALKQLKNDKVLTILMSNVDPQYSSSNTLDKSSLYPTSSSIEFKDFIHIKDVNDEAYKKVDDFIDMPFKVYKRDLKWTTSSGETYDLYLLLNRKIDGTYDYIGVYSDTPTELLSVDQLVY